MDMIEARTGSQEDELLIGGCVALIGWLEGFVLLVGEDREAGIWQK